MADHPLKPTAKDLPATIVAGAGLGLQRFRRLLLPGYWPATPNQIKGDHRQDKGHEPPPDLAIGASPAEGDRHSLRGAAIPLVRLPSQPPETSGLQQSCSAARMAWIEHVTLLTQAAVSCAPLQALCWSLQLRLRPDLLPDSSLQLSASESWLELRFRTCHPRSLALLCEHEAALVRQLQSSLPQRALRIEVLNELPSNVTHT